MTRSELIVRLTDQYINISSELIDQAIKEILEYMTLTLAHGERIEIRGFGSFSLHYREPRIGRNPKTGDQVQLIGKYVPYFKPGKELRYRINRTYT